MNYVLEKCYQKDYHLNLHYPNLKKSKLLQHFESFYLYIDFEVGIYSFYNKPEYGFLSFALDGNNISSSIIVIIFSIKHIKHKVLKKLT